MCAELRKKQRCGAKLQAFTFTNLLINGLFIPPLFRTCPRVKREPVLLSTARDYSCFSLGMTVISADCKTIPLRKSRLTLSVLILEPWLMSNCMAQVAE